jgi:hypothetical protein
VTFPFHKLLRENFHVVWLAVLTVALSVSWFLIDGNVKVNLADEGYLWYGTVAVRAGEVPFRDFQAYDPGRYWWTGGWSYLLGEGLLSMRLACVFFQCFGILAGLLAARRLSRNWLFLICFALLLCGWMHPRYKVFEQSIALMSVYAGVLLLENPSLRRHFVVGLFGGLMAFMGRNHGAYHLLAFGLIIAWASFRQSGRVWARRGTAWGSGLLLGYLPQWLMFVFVPGYFQAFMESLHEIFAKGTNLAAKVPWPWLMPDDYTGWSRWCLFAEGCFFVAFPVLFLLVGIRVWRLIGTRRSVNAVLVAAACVTLPYTHYVFSRPDGVHLTHGAPTLVLAVLALSFTFSGGWRRLGLVLAPVLLVMTFSANLFLYGATIQVLAEPQSLYDFPVRKQMMVVTNTYAKTLAGALILDQRLAKKSEPILFLPHMPGLYPLTERRSPIRQIYLIFPATPEEDRALLAEIEKANVQWVMLLDFPLDGRDDLRFRNTHPIVSAYFHENFEPVTINTLPPGLVVLHRRPNA